MRTLALLACLGLAAQAGDSPDRALAALRTAPRAERERFVQDLVASKRDPAAVLTKLKDGVEVAAIGAGWHVLAATDEHGVRRPFQLYVPPSLAGKSAPVPLLVHLHGGVSRPDFARGPAAVGYGRRWTGPAEEAGFCVCFPLARRDCMWWSDAGVAHVRAVIREVKRLVPVDDDAIIGTGFSDGASGCFHLAMAAPWPFAGFLPMNGHPAVAANASGKQLYLNNMARSTLFAAMTQDDPLYPAASVLEHLRLAMEAGVRIRLVNHERGSHTPAYWEDQLPAFVNFITDTTREPFPREIEWRCSDAATGAVAWLEVLEVGPAAGDAPAVRDLNVMSTPGRVRLGFNVDRAFPGPGVKVENVLEGTTASRLGMRKGDVVVRLDASAITNLQELIAALGRKRFDETVEVEVLRGEDKAVMRGRIPPFKSEPYYRRARPTARISVRVDAEGFAVISRNVRRFRMHLPHDWTGPVTVAVNGAEHAPEVSDVPFADVLRRYAREADGGRLYTRFVEVELPPR